MTPDKKRALLDRALIVLNCLLVYFLMDYPIRVTNAYGFPVTVGIKNFLPFVLGMFWGPWSAAGAEAGMLISALLYGTAGTETVSEGICILLAAMGLRWIWFAVNRDGNVRLESLKNVLVYAAAVLVISLLCGEVSALLEGAGSFMPAMIGPLLCGLLIGIPVHILLSGIFCVKLIPPVWIRLSHDVDVCLRPEHAGPDTINEAVESVGMEKKIPMKRIFEIESCLEELYIRIRKMLPDTEILGEIDLDSTISMQLRYEGRRYNPLRSGADEDEMDEIGLKLIRHRALRASWSYRRGENRIHIVV